MKKFFLLGLLCSFCLVSIGQLALVSEKMSVSEWNDNLEKYLDRSKREVRNYINWKDGELTIICSDCKNDVFKYVALNRVKEDESVGDGFTVDTYTAVELSTGMKLRIMLGYSHGKLSNLSVVRPRTGMVIYGELHDQ
ncbi:MAG: hypothetical protein EOO08_12610 [Chitinophagaceae bacterium]|nr:MAG: hypothetical protein EOO08_12610 [Chitinophagaceae bacterium]